MRFAKVESKYYCGIDLHSRSMYISVMDKEGEILFHRNMPNDFDIFKNYVERFRPEMAVGVESSCYYYWLADACKVIVDQMTPNGYISCQTAIRDFLLASSGTQQLVSACPAGQLRQ